MYSLILKEIFENYDSSQLYKILSEAWHATHRNQNSLRTWIRPTEDVRALTLEVV